LWLLDKKEKVEEEYRSDSDQATRQFAAGVPGLDGERDESRKIPQ